jgi:hypothetical protein
MLLWSLFVIVDSSFLFESPALARDNPRASARQALTLGPSPTRDYDCLGILSKPTNRQPPSVCRKYACTGLFHESLRPLIALSSTLIKTSGAEGRPGARICGRSPRG